MSKISKEVLDSVFHAYDIRGEITELTEAFFYQLGKAYAIFLDGTEIVVGYDIRPESQLFSESFIKGATEMGLNITNIGEVATEMMYFAVGNNRNMDGGVVITASHNPAGWNGAKLVRENAEPISADSGLKEISALMEQEIKSKNADQYGKVSELDIYPEFKQKILSFLGNADVSDLKIVVDAGNGVGGKIFDYVFADLGMNVKKLFFEPDGNFPNHVPNPIKEENVQDIKREIKSAKYDLGIAIDGDADRVFFLDDSGRNPMGLYTGSIIADHLASVSENSKILHDPRVTWPLTKESKNYEPIVTKSGHSFIKERMKREDALFGIELSSHFFYKDFYNADSGMITIALMLKLIANGLDFSEKLDYLYSTYPSSGEVNFKVKKTIEQIFTELKAKYSDALDITEIDGLSIEFDSWRCNVRASNTEPVVRLNVEAESVEVLKERFLEVSKIIGGERKNAPALEGL